MDVVMYYVIGPLTSFGDRMDEAAKDYKPTVGTSSQPQYHYKDAQIVSSVTGLHPKMFGKAALYRGLQAPLNKALKGLEFSDACSDVASNLFTSVGPLDQLSYTLQNTGTINKCLNDAYVYTKSIDPDTVFSNLRDYFDRVSQYAGDYFLTPQARAYIKGLAPIDLLGGFSFKANPSTSSPKSWSEWLALESRWDFWVGDKLKADMSGIWSISGALSSMLLHSAQCYRVMLTIMS